MRYRTGLLEALRKTYTCVVPCPPKFNRLSVSLEAGGIEAIVSETELNDTARAIPYG
jgi:hypothetical protein